jgi:hypothetical protein
VKFDFIAVQVENNSGMVIYLNAERIRCVHAMPSQRMATIQMDDNTSIKVAGEHAEKLLGVISVMTLHC